MRLNSLLSIVVFSAIFLSPTVMASKGAAISIQHGVVEKVENVKADSAAGRNMLIGGAIG